MLFYNQDAFQNIHWGGGISWYITLIEYLDFALTTWEPKRSAKLILNPYNFCINLIRFLCFNGKNDYGRYCSKVFLTLVLPVPDDKICVNFSGLCNCKKILKIANYLRRNITIFQQRKVILKITPCQHKKVLFYLWIMHKKALNVCHIIKCLWQ